MSRKKHKSSNKKCKIKYNYKNIDTDDENKETDTQANQNNQNENIEPEVDINDLLRQLGILNLSGNMIILIIIATILNFKFINWQKIKILDTLNSTNFSENSPDISNIPRLTNRIFLIATATFLGINYNELKRQYYDPNSDNRSITIANRNVLSSMLVFMATLVSRDTLEL